MNKFSYLDYKTLIIDLMSAGKNKGRGQNARLSKHLSVHTTFLTHVLRGGSHLSQEQTLKVADFFSFSLLETDYLVNLVCFNRAGDQQTKNYYKKKVEQIRIEGLSLKEQLKKQSKMTVEEQSIFYSEWTYSAVRLCTALPEGNSVESIAKMLNLPFSKVSKIVDFLIKTNLCKYNNERLTYNVFSTYADSSSPFAKKLHDNWRMRTVAFGSSQAEDLTYTSAVTLTKQDFLLFRDTILELLKNFESLTDVSEPKTLAYLTLDWIKVV
jgi:uncharacterized protein (TIGR02147 family)